MPSSPFAGVCFVWIAGRDSLTAVLLGRGNDEIIAMMGEQGIFHILTTMLMYPPTTELTSACIGRLAGTSDSAAREAQVPDSIMLFNDTTLLIVSWWSIHIRSGACLYVKQQFTYVLSLQQGCCLSICFLCSDVRSLGFSSIYWFLIDILVSY